MITVTIIDSPSRTNAIASQMNQIVTKIMHSHGNLNPIKTKELNKNTPANISFINSVSDKDAISLYSKEDTTISPTRQASHASPETA
mmetsp:Transcript_2387/g.3408  ORF Transcript_2387/g.3408 Transcript_2387/m.3408 type:complete len:87 (-) Transcript_2387:317-577(-)